MERGGCHTIESAGGSMIRFLSRVFVSAIVRKLAYMLVVFAVLAFSHCAHAAALSVDFQKMTISELIQTVYGEILQRSFVVDSSVVSDDSLVTITLKDIAPDVVDQEIRKILDAHGYAVDGKSVLHFHRRDPAKDIQDTILVYRPLYRSVAYLLDLSAPLFKQGAFTAQRRRSGINLAQITGGVPASGSAAVPAAVAEQGVNVTTDRDVDVLIFHGSLEDVDRIKGLLSQVDTPSGQVLVNAIVYEVQTTKQDGSAVDLLASVLSAKFGLNIVGGAATAASSVFFKLPIGKLLDLSAVYSAVNSDDRFKILTSPRVRVMSGGTARFAVGNETPVLGAVSLDATGRATQSVNYKPSGVIFDISPIVRDGGSDILVSQTISQFITTTTGVNGSPTLTKRELSTHITVHDNEVVMLGGLDEDRSTSNDSGLSFLPDWLRTKSKQGQHTEVVLLLRVQRL